MSETAIINPGTGSCRGASFRRARANMFALLRDAGPGARKGTLRLTCNDLHLHPLLSAKTLPEAQREAEELIRERLKKLLAQLKEKGDG